MRLNPDCIRDILLQVENGSFTLPNRSRIQDTFFEELEFLKNYSSIEIFYHINQCNMMDFILISENLKETTIYDLTPAGHSFLADIRNNTIWNKTKSTAKELGISSLHGFKEISVNVIAAIISSKFTRK